jgi:hypothetical protein
MKIIAEMFPFPWSGFCTGASVWVLAISACAWAQGDGKINRTVEPPHSGSIQLEPDQGYYEVGQKIRVTATPRGRFTFGEWGGTVKPEAPNPYLDFVVGKENRIVAKFEAGYLSDRPLLSPRRNSFYLEEPRDLWFQIHQNGHELISIERSGVAVGHSRSEMVAGDSESLVDSLSIRISAEEMTRMGAGRHRLDFGFDHGKVLDVEIEVIPEGAGRLHDWNIVSFYVGHGTAVFMNLPNGETVMIDCGTREAAERFIVPFLKDHLPVDESGRQRIDHVFITHWHYDHFHGLGPLLEAFEVGQVRYNLSAPPNAEGRYSARTNPNDPYGYGHYGFEPRHWEEFKVGNRISNIGGVEMQVLNAALVDDEDERFRLYRSEFYEHWFGRNNRSLSLKLAYQGFVYVHGGDIYQHAQRAIAEALPDAVRAHVYHGNHHFHGGIESDYLIRTDPYLFLTSANSAVYDRDAFAETVLNQVIPELEQNSQRFRENLLSFEVGHTVIRVDGKKNWTCDSTELVYETYFLNTLNPRKHKVPYLY